MIKIAFTDTVLDVGFCEKENGILDKSEYAQYVEVRQHLAIRTKISPYLARNSFHLHIHSP
jgi:hypothetical protein